MGESGGESGGHDQGPNCTGETRKMEIKRIPVRENTGNLKFWQNTGNFVWSTPQFPNLYGARILQYLLLNYPSNFIKLYT